MRIKATELASPHRVNYQLDFYVYFESLLVVRCSLAQFTQPQPLAPITVDLYAAEPLVFELEEISDSGTPILQATPGYEDQTCLPFEYKQKTVHTLVVQDTSNERSFSIQVIDPALVGEHSFEVEVSSP